MKFIFVSGGVISGLGKGITAASVGRLLQSKGFRVTAVKIDMYLNVDAGTIRPTEHGEVFVTDDGIETDQDLGNYERFLETDLTRANYITTGQVYQEVIRKERAFAYKGEDVEAIPHVSDEIIKRIRLAAEENNAEITIVELGGTVGEYQNALFFEASRIMKLRKPRDIMQIHVAYLPIPHTLGEMKSKPVQQSVKLLNSMGIQPNFVIGRADVAMDDKRKERLALFCNVEKKNIISNPDVESIYEVPIILDEQHLAQKILKQFGLKPRKKDLADWRQLVTTIKTVKKPVKIAIVGKYFSTGDFTLSDSYISVIEALKHGSWANNVKPELTWIGTEEFDPTSPSGLRGTSSDPKSVSKLKEFDGVVIPQGWGSRGVEGKIAAIKFLREHKIPYLGLCFGMQMAVIEFARNVCNLKDANSEEVDEKTKNPVIHIMPNQKEYLKKHQYGGTIRLGAYPCLIKPNSLLHMAYSQSISDKQLANSDLQVFERHRHRYEVNNAYRQSLIANGLVISGTSPDGELVEAIELPKKVHPFFVGVQSHPEYKSRPLSPHPIFVEFIRSASLRSPR